MQRVLPSNTRNDLVFERYRCSTSWVRRRYRSTYESVTIGGRTSTRSNSCASERSWSTRLRVESSRSEPSRGAQRSNWRAAPHDVEVFTLDLPPALADRAGVPAEGAKVRA